MEQQYFIGNGHAEIQHLLRHHLYLSLNLATYLSLRKLTVKI